jgi:hypothetical protein
MPDEPILPSHITFLDESEGEALSRYTGFGDSVWVDLWKERPELRAGFQYYRDPNTTDLWSWCRCGQASCGLQLDPDIEVIVFWDASIQLEIGTWSTDLVAEAVEWIVHRVTYPHSEGPPPPGGNPARNRPES